MWVQAQHIVVVCTYLSMAKRTPLRVSTWNRSFVRTGDTPQLNSDPSIPSITDRSMSATVKFHLKYVKEVTKNHVKFSSSLSLFAYISSPLISLASLTVILDTATFSTSNLCISDLLS